MSTPLNTAFKEKSNTMLNNTAFTSCKLSLMKDDAKRLYEAAQELLGISGQSELARALGESPQTVKNWETRGLSKNGLLTAQRVIGCSADWLEFGRGNMTRRGDAERQSGRETCGLCVVAREDSVDVPLMNAAGSMGPGLPAPEHETVVDVLRLSKDWVHSNLKSISSPANLAALSAYGDSMQPTFTDGDILIVDRGVSEIRLDAVYVLQLHGELFVKRVQRRITDGAVIIRSDNVNYEPAVISNGERESLRVLGRVVWAWNGRKL
jgi:phage repressor protein C with HTH and peptisase S24 domain